MMRLIIRRLGLSIVLVLVVSALTFVLASLTPGDAARSILGSHYTPEQYAQLRHQLGLDESLPAQYWHWLRDALHGSLGTSVFNGQPVGQAIAERLGATLSLVAGTLLVSAVVGVGIGVLAALRGGVGARVVDLLALVGFALPSFWLGLVLVAVFAVGVHMLPATGYVAIADSPGGWLESLVLPVATLSVGAIAVIAKQARDAVLDVLDREFVWCLRARGLSERRIIVRHVLRNAGIPIVTVLGLVSVGLLSGTVLVEAVFAVPGLGGQAVQATSAHDLPVVQGVAVAFTLIVVAVNLLIDLAYGWLNPKARIT
ncbi:MAG: peptide/nickel transport system permease protein [Solirubrobacteraceae bacterium]